MPATVLVALFLAAAPAGNLAHGSVRRGAATSELSHACVLQVWESADQRATLVYAATVALDCAAAMDTLEPEGFLDAAVERAGGAAARLRLRPADPNVSFSFVRHEPRDSFFISGVSTRLEVERHDRARLEGRFSGGAEAIAGVDTEVELRFAAAIADGAVSGQALGPGGGDPGKAYLEYVAALGRKDFAAIQRLTVGKAANQALSGGFEAFRLREPRQAEILGGELRGAGRDVAHLRIRARTHGGDSIRTRVRLERDEDRSWRLRDRGLTVLESTDGGNP